MARDEGRGGDRFAGRRALVTGASRGIGAAVAVQLAREGAAVAITARTAEPTDRLPGSLAETATRIREVGAEPVVVVADLADPDGRARLVGEAVAGLGGPVDVLVNNAAAAIYQPLLDYPRHRRRLTFEVNVEAPFDLIQAVVPAMVERGEGWIVNLSSATARPLDRPAEEASPLAATTGVYAASKAALNRLTQALAVELRGTGVRINTVEPRAAVLTEGAAALVGSRLRPEQVEPLDGMVEAVLRLCDAPASTTGGIHVSTDLLEQRGR